MPDLGKYNKQNMVERNTIQKQLVMNTVAKLKNHPTAEQVYEDIHDSHPNVSKATVYRNLKQLSDAGKLKRIESVNLADHYDHQCHDHYHVQCSKCNRVYDVDMDYINDLNDQAMISNGFQIDGHDIVFKGICPECKFKKS